MSELWGKHHSSVLGKDKLWGLVLKQKGDRQLAGAEKAQRFALPRIKALVDTGLAKANIHGG